MKSARLVALVTLIFLGLSSFAGSVPLILDPSGGMLKMPLSLLDHSPFRNFLIPGLILFMLNGVLSLVIAIPVVRKTRNSGPWVALQGCVILGWITVQVILIRGVGWPHFVYWGTGLVLMACGWVLYRGAESKAVREVHASS
jgi:hypothetical protein